MNIKGHKNDPVELRTLSVGDWYTNERWPQPFVSKCTQYPSKITHRSGDRVWSLTTGGSSGFEYGDSLVHPLTKIGDDFWYRGSEPKASPLIRLGTLANAHGLKPSEMIGVLVDSYRSSEQDDRPSMSVIAARLASCEHKIAMLNKDLAALESRERPSDDIRPIGELPVGTEFDYADVRHSDSNTGSRHVGKRIEGDRVWVMRNGNIWRSASDDTPVRVIRYPDPQPAPSPTYLERLPQALRDIGLTEYQARMVWESRDATFVAGEPVGNYRAQSSGGKSIGVGVDANKKYTHLIDNGSGYSLVNPDALRFARRTAAIALREGGAK